ncbi:MAG: hypothetical protein LAP39_00270 [Acidobacteriia bacterium]|nr:hypothetical protein [Terriglobia bacterium]
MPHLPQLSSGATGQYPIQKRRAERTIINQLSDGRTVKLADTGAEWVEWQLTYQDLADSEIANLQQFFSACEGQLNGFTFLDPMDNLLMWSEDLTQTVWESSTLLQLTGGINDPSGGSRATRIANPTSADLTVQQNVNAPGGLVYCFSLYVRGESGTMVSLFRQTADAFNGRSYTLAATWNRISLSGSLSTLAPSITFGITIPAGNSVDVYGCQLEAQPAPSPYKASFSASGVYPNAHFSQDSLAVTTTAPNRNQCTLTLSAR